MSKSGAEDGARCAPGVALGVTLAILVAGLCGVRPASAAAEGGSFELGDPVSRTLHQLQEDRKSVV